MDKLKKIVLSMFAAILAFFSGQVNTYAQMMRPMYGIEVPAVPTPLQSVLSFLLSPITIIVSLLLALILGVVAYLKLKKRAKKNP